MKQVFKVTYPWGKIYIAKAACESGRYFGTPDRDIVNADFLQLPPDARKRYSVAKEILWESDTASNAEASAMEVQMILKFDSNNPKVGYNRWPKWKGEQPVGF